MFFIAHIFCERIRGLRDFSVYHVHTSLLILHSGKMQYLTADHNSSVIRCHRTWLACVRQMNTSVKEYLSITIYYNSNICFSFHGAHLWYGATIHTVCLGFGRLILDLESFSYSFIGLKFGSIMRHCIMVSLSDRNSCVSMRNR